MAISKNSTRDLTKEDWFIISVSLLGAVVFILFIILLYLVCSIIRLKNTRRHSLRDSHQTAVPDTLVKIKEKIQQKRGLKLNPNIYFLGLQGTGKSSLINSLIAAVNRDGYYEQFRVGQLAIFEPGAVTAELKAYEMSEEFYEGSITEPQQFHFSPTLWDCPPFLNEDSEKAKCVLKHLIGGAIPEGEEVNKLLSLSDQELEAKWVPNDDIKADLIVVVLDEKSEPLPTNFISAVVSTAAGIPIIVVINKTDKMKSPTVTVKKIKERLKKFRADGVKVLGVKSYTQFVERSDRRKAVDKDMCKIWTSIIDFL